MKHILLGIVMLFVGVIGLSAPASANVDDFVINRFHVNYLLEKDADGRAIMRVEETIIAGFPEFQQNKGIVRAIPTHYKTFDTSPTLLSVTRNGQPEPIYSESRQAGEYTLSLGTDDYVLGTQTYVITYTLKNVIADFGDYQELYWDINGTGWAQRVRQVSAVVRVSDDLKPSLTGDLLCFQGSFGSTARCDTSQADGVSLFRSVGSLGAFQTATLAIKFAPNTFIMPAKTPLHYLPIIALFLVSATLLFTLYRLYRYGRNHPGRGAIVTEYLPPKHTAVLTAAIVKGRTAKLATAQIIDLAIRDHIKIIDHSADGRKGEFSIEIVNPKGIDDIEKAFLDALIPTIPIGGSFRFERRPSATTMTTGARLRAVINKHLRPFDGNHLRHKPAQLKRITLPLLVLVPVAAIFFILDLYEYGPFISQIAAAVSFIYIWVTIHAASVRPLTEEGRALLDYLKGLERYIKLAEKDRIELLQSVTGAERSQSTVKLYERVLPYAILFGHEKSWAKALTVLYEAEGSTHRAWLQGASISNLSRSLSSFGSATQGYTATASSSGSSFSGGGSAGGGGGGGGGGGR